jgi:rubrerythrin
MSSDGGKGSARRKEDVSKIHENWDRIFGKKDNKPMIDEHDDPQERSDEDYERSEEEWTCDVCGGPMYSAPHWSYGQCDDCGARQELINDDYT